MAQISLAQENATSIDWEYENIVALRWKIGNPPDISYNGLQFDMMFTVSDYITEDHVRYDLYEGSGCGYVGGLITNAGYISGNVVTDNSPVGGGLSTRIITLENSLVPRNITKSTSYVENGNNAAISFCVRFQLWSGPVSDTEATLINDQDVLVSLVVDLTDNFSISSQNVEARDRAVQTTDDEFFVDAFLCEETGLAPQDSVPMLQGQVIRVCVQPTQQALDVGFRMRRIDKFTFVQGYTTQEAVINQQASSNGLTELWCDAGNIQCAFETLLFAYFFEASQGNVGGSGIASLQWGDPVSRRQLINDDDDEIENLFDGSEGSDDDEVYESGRKLQREKSFSVDVFKVQAVLREPRKEYFSAGGTRGKGSWHAPSSWLIPLFLCCLLWDA